MGRPLLNAGTELASAEPAPGKIHGCKKLMGPSTTL